MFFYAQFEKAHKKKTVDGNPPRATFLLDSELLMDEMFAAAVVVSQLKEITLKSLCFFEVKSC